MTAEHITLATIVIVIVLSVTFFMSIILRDEENK